MTAVAASLSRHSVILVALLGVASGRLDAQVRSEYAEMHMGVSVRIVLHAPDVRAGPDAARAAFDRIAELEDKMSDYRPESELRRLERRAGEQVSVSPELYDVLARAVEIARDSDGAFDPTVGPLVALWREARRSGRLPPRSRLDSARALVGWRKLSVDSARRTVRLAPGMRLDLGGIAKGYILQAALAVLRARGVTQALIEAGGDIVVGDPPPGRESWHIDAPHADAAMAAAAASLVRAALATSGGTIQFVEIDGVRYSHVIDPRTGLGVTNASIATVIAPDGALADALATALTVLGAERGQKLLDRYPAARGSVQPASLRR